MHESTTLSTTNEVLPSPKADTLVDGPMVDAEDLVQISSSSKRDRFAALLYLALRAGNSGATVLAGFLTTFLLVRRLGVDGYAAYVITTAVGIYLSATDAGISRTVYAKLRQAFLGGNLNEERVRVAGALLLYGVVTTVALLIFVAVQFTTGQAADEAAQSLYFFYVALNLPWMLLRYIAWAIDKHVWFDSIDLVRRCAQIAIFFLALTALDLWTVFALLDLVWIVGFAAGLMIVKRRLGSQSQIASARQSIAQFWAGYGTMVRSSAAFSLIEFAIYNFPFFLIPLVYGKGMALVAFDLFYKLFRAGVVGNQIASTTVLPRQTRAFHAHDAAGVRRWTQSAVLLSIVAVSPLALGLLILGHQALHLLLSGASVIGATGIAAVVIAVYSNSFQNAAGSLLIHVGLIRQGVHISYTILAIMALLSVVAGMGLLSVEHFILAYALAYALGSAAWTALAARAIGKHFAVHEPALSGEPA